MRQRLLGRTFSACRERVADHISPSSNLTKSIIWAAAERGLLVGKVGLYGNVIRLAPPLVINRQEIDFAIEILDESLAKALD